MPTTLSILASCNFFRSNNFLASLAVIQAHSIYLIMTSFLYTEQILFVRLPIGFGDRPVKSFYSFRTRYRPIVGLELLILLFCSLIKLTSLHRLGICCNNQTLWEALFIKTIDRYNRNANTRKIQYCSNAGKKREEDAQ